MIVERLFPDDVFSQFLKLLSMKCFLFCFLSLGVLSQMRDCFLCAKVDTIQYNDHDNKRLPLRPCNSVLLPSVIHSFGIQFTHGSRPFHLSAWIVRYIPPCIRESLSKMEICSTRLFHPVVFCTSMLLLKSKLKARNELAFRNEIS